MTSLVQQVKGRLSIHVRRRSLALLEGGYASIHRGRSMDFEDLREYAPGDDVRDIDWKASARHGSMLIRRYVAERHFGLVVVAPGGREMAAATTSGERKRDVAALAAGVIGWLAVRHGDEVSLVGGAPGSIHATRARSSEGHLERLLQEVVARSSEDGAKADLPGLLRHEVLWLTVEGVDPVAVQGGARVRDVGSGQVLPSLLEIAPEVGEVFAREEAARRGDLVATLRRLDIGTARVGSRDEVVPAVIRLLERRRRGR